MILQTSARPGLAHLEGGCPCRRTLGQAETGTSVQLPGGGSISLTYGSGVPYGAYNPAVYGQGGLPFSQVPLSQWLSEPNGVFPSFSNLGVVGGIGVAVLLLYASRRRFA